jgi:fermentation-respiration switch protein FrsA (DUF1100 family)
VNFVLRLTVCVLCTALAACTIVVSENRLIRPRPGAAANPDDITKRAPGFALTRHEVVAADGVRLKGVHLRQSGSRITVLYFGGNGYTIGRYASWTAYSFAPLGVDVFVADHRGYGQSGGTATTATLASDGLTLFDYVASLPGLDANRIVVHGHSLGSFIAGHVAANRPAAGVVLESSATTAEDWAKTATPGYLKPFVRTKVADELRGQGNLPNMPRIDEPLLVLVGKKDKTTPVRLSEALYAASPLPESRKWFVVVPDAGHNDSMIHTETQTAYRRLLESVRLTAY